MSYFGVLFFLITFFIIFIGEENVKNLFRSNKKNIFIKKIDEVLLEYSYFHIAVSDVRKQLIDWVNKINKKSVEEILLKDEEYIKDFISVKLLRILYYNLISGHYHQYRGYLCSMRGGADMLIMYKNLINKAVNKGTITKEEGMIVIKKIKKDVEEAG